MTRERNIIISRILIIFNSTYIIINCCYNITTIIKNIIKFLKIKNNKKEYYNIIQWNKLDISILSITNFTFTKFAKFPNVIAHNHTKRGNDICLLIQKLEFYSLSNLQRLIHVKLISDGSWK